MNAKLQTLKGFRDFLPEDAIKRQWLKSRLSTILESWGYDPMETPTLEPLELFAGQIGEDEKLFFKFKDPGGRDVALRYDQTVPTCRVVGQYANKLPFPFKRYQIQQAYRAENPQKGRYREFIQCDADIFGTTSPYADAECIALSIDIYRQLGFPKALVRINDRTLLKDIPYQAIVSIDKLEKIGKKGVVEDMQMKGITKEQAEFYLNRVLFLEPNETITIILDYLKSLGFEKDWYAFDPTIARSFSYSTGPIWEVVIPGVVSGSVLGGERYDLLVEKFTGIKIPGTGFGLGFDRTLEVAEQLGLVPYKKTLSKILVTIFSSDLKDQSLNISKTIRDSGIQGEFYPDPDAKLEKQLKYADKKGIPYVIIMGPDEVRDGVVVLKSMKEKTQEKLPLSDVIRKLSKDQ